MAFRIAETAIPEVKTIAVDRFGDARGYFVEVYSRRAFAEAGIGIDFVQDNHSRSAAVGSSPSCAWTAWASHPSG